MWTLYFINGLEKDNIDNGSNALKTFWHHFDSAYIVHLCMITD